MSHIKLQDLGSKQPSTTCLRAVPRVLGECVAGADFLRFDLGPGVDIVRVQASFGIIRALVAYSAVRTVAPLSQALAMDGAMPSHATNHCLCDRGSFGNHRSEAVASDTGKLSRLSRVY